MIELRIEEDCKECGEKNAVRATVRIKDEHKISREWGFERDSLTVYWSHPGFKQDDCIKIVCKECGILYMLDTGPFEMHRYLEKRQKVFTGAWIPERLGELIEE